MLSETTEHHLHIGEENLRIPEPIANFPLDKAAMNAAVKNSQLLIVDDEPSNLAMLTDMLEEAEYSHIQSTQDPRQVYALCETFQPNLILLDQMMPHMSGMQVMQQLKAEGSPFSGVPILMLTADVTSRIKRQALNQGAKDFLTKPFDMSELLLRIFNLLENHILYLNLQQQNTTLEQRVVARTAQLEEARQRISDYAHDLEKAHFEMLERLAWAGEFRDDDTGFHTQRVGATTALLAVKLGLPEEEVRWLHQAARLHDVGKIGISDLILLKKGKLTDEEFTIVKTHTTIGSQLLDGGHSEMIQIAQRIARSHHERWDGRGYPDGLKEDETPVEARLLAVADVFDALTHDRPYKNAWPVAEAVAEIQSQSGKHFDPQIVEVFLQLDHNSLI
jgi:putative two-component system response regulator